MLCGGVWLIVTLITEHVEGETEWSLIDESMWYQLKIFSLKVWSSPAAFFFCALSTQTQCVFSVLLYLTVFLKYKNNRVSNSVAPTWFTWGYLLHGSYTWSMRQSQWLLGNGSPHGLSCELPENQALLSESLATLETWVSMTMSGPYTVEIRYVCSWAFKVTFQ